MTTHSKNKQIAHLELTAIDTPEEAHAFGREIANALVLPVLAPAVLFLGVESREHAWRGLISSLLGSMESDCGHPLVRQYLQTLDVVTRHPVGSATHLPSVH